MKISDYGKINYNKLLEGKRVFITTGSRGIGKDIALLFAHQGAKIAIGGRNKKEVEQVALELNGIGSGAKGYKLDLSVKEETEAICDQILLDFDGIDVLINTVGVNQQAHAHDITDEDLEWMLETNYKSGLRCARKFLPGMMERKNGSIVNISSIHADQTMPKFTVYAGTKGAMNASARAMAMSYAPYGIRVNNLSPGLILSAVMMDEVNSYPEGAERDAFMALLTSMQPLPPGQMEDVSNTALFLASDMSAYITGQTIMVDGGATCKAH